MEYYRTKKSSSAASCVVVDDMILTKDMPTAAGSKMLDGFMSLFDAEVVTKLADAGYGICGKAKTGEFAFDLLGETAFDGACIVDGALKSAAAEIVKSGDAQAAVCLDVNGSVCRGAAQAGLISIKPTYGTVSRFGTIPVACSGETVSIMAASADKCKELLAAVAGHDDKDGTSLSDDECKRGLASSASVKKVAVLKSVLDSVGADVKAQLDKVVSALSANGVEVAELDDSIIKLSRIAWNILMSAELCNNVSRYDGVKYGYRSQNFTNIDELYTNSRTEAFGELLKTAILFGSETLSTDNYMKVYDKALRTRRVISEEFAKLFESYDAILLPACSKMAYTEDYIKENKYAAFEENLFTAPASVTGLPAVVAGGVQLIGKAFSEDALLDVAKLIEKEAE